MNQRLESLLSSAPPLVAVDPGMSGAVVSFSNGLVFAARDFKEPTDLVIAVYSSAYDARIACVEFVAARPGQGVCSMFSFGQSTGLALGALYVRGFTHPDCLLRPTPQSWQKWAREYLSLPKTAFRPPDGGGLDSRALLLEYLPSAEKWLTRKKDHNTADAILLGLFAAHHYHQRTYDPPS